MLDPSGRSAEVKSSRSALPFELQKLFYPVQSELEIINLSLELLELGYSLHGNPNYKLF
jgi:hypothetical protein